MLESCPHVVHVVGIRLIGQCEEDALHGRHTHRNLPTHGTSEIAADIGRERQPTERLDTYQPVARIFRCTHQGLVHGRFDVQTTDQNLGIADGVLNGRSDRFTEVELVIPGTPITGGMAPGFATTAGTKVLTLLDQVMSYRASLTAAKESSIC